ncbi:MAG: glycine zipper domain-containing protein, partial [Caulobacteraceae bacterium]
VKGKVDEALGAAQDLYGRAAERAKGLAGDVDTLISDNPYATLGVGVAVGLLIGVLVGALIAGRD